MMKEYIQIKELEKEDIKFYLSKKIIKNLIMSQLNLRWITF